MVFLRTSPQFPASSGLSRRNGVYATVKARCRVYFAGAASPAVVRVGKMGEPRSIPPIPYP